MPNLSLSLALEIVQESLISFVSNDRFLAHLALAFGDNFDLTVARTLAQAWRERDFSMIPEIKILSASVINGARGAFAAENNTIYLAEEFIAENANNVPEIASVLLEEIGHFVDSQLNTTDTLGDEGELFSDLVRGVEISETELQRLRLEDDHAAVTIDGQTLQVEQSNYSLGVVQGSLSWNDSVSYSDSYDNWTFQIAATGTSSNYISVTSNSTLVDFVLALYDQYGNFLTSSNQYNYSYNYESLSLSGLSAGTYIAQVYDSYSGQYVYPSSASYTLSINAPQPLADLTLYQPSGWSDGIVISTTSGTTTDAAQITTTDSIYIDWASINQGLGTTGQGFSARLLLDGTVLESWNAPVLDAGLYIYLNDFEIAPLSAGNHTLKLEIDYLNLIAETNESNNIFTKTFTVTGSSIPQDAYEANNSFSTATILQPFDGLKSIPNLSIHNSTDVDIFRFTLTGQTTDENYISTLFSPSEGTVDLELRDSTGTTVLYSAYGSSGWNYIPLLGLSAGTYNIVTGSVNQSTSPNYTLWLNLPNVSSNDRFESNNTFSTPKDLGPVSGFRQENNLSITSSDQDWFKFTISEQTTAQNYISIDFDDSGDLDIALYNSQNQLIDSSSGVDNSEIISLGSLIQGTYYLKVYGYFGSTNDYNLTINAPGTTSSIATDQFEANGGNNTRQTATNLKNFDWGQQVGFKAWENISIGTNDQDWFKFELQATGTLSDYVAIGFDTYQGDLDLELYNASGTLIKSAKGFRDTESISLENLAIGTYYAKVSGYTGKTNPNYTLFINTPGSDRFEENDSRAQATSLTRTTPLQTWDSLSLDDEDWFKITLPNGVTSNDYVSISFDHSQGDIDLELYDSSGTKISSSTGVGNSESISLPTLIYLGNPPSADYYVRVFGYGNATNPNYSLTVNAPISNTGDWLEANNTQATAKDLNTQFSQQLQAGETFIQLGVDAEKPLSIHNNTDKDWFKFTIASAGQLGDYASISFDHTAGDLDLYLYNSPTATTSIRKSEGIANTQTIDLKGLAAGTYYLQVAGYGGATNSAYSLAIQAPFVPKTGDWSESNNTIATAKDLGTIIDTYNKGNLSIHNTTDVDWFKFTLGAKGGLDDRIGINFNHGQGDLDIQLYQADGTTLLGSSSGVTGTEEISLNTLVAGNYYLKVFGYSGATNPDYSLFIEAPEDINGDWAEQNNTIATARDLRNVEGFQTWDTLSIHNTTDVDWFKFTTIGTGDANDVVRIAFDQSLGDLELYVLSAAGNKLYDATGKERKSETINNVEEVSLKGLAAGTYLIQVKGYNGAINPSYQLAINAPDSSTISSDWADKNGSNNTRATAEDLLKLEGTKVFSGLSIHQGGDEDWFKFETVATGIANNAVSINFDRDNGNGDLKLELYNSAGTLITTSNENSNRELISLAGRNAGVYFVRVLGNSTSVTNPSYSLVFDVPEIAEADWIDKGNKPNNSLANAYDLRSINDSLTLSDLSIDTATDQDWFKVVVKQKTNSNQFARIDFNNDEGNLKLELFDASGTVLATSETTENFEQISLAGRDAGTYYVKVSGAANPNYTLTVQGVPDTVADGIEGTTNSPSNPYNLRDLAIGGGRGFEELLQILKFVTEYKQLITQQTITQTAFRDPHRGYNNLESLGLDSNLFRAGVYGSNSYNSYNSYRPSQPADRKVYYDQNGNLYNQNGKYIATSILGRYSYAYGATLQDLKDLSDARNGTIEFVQLPSYEQQISSLPLASGNTASYSDELPIISGSSEQQSSTSFNFSGSQSTSSIDDSYAELESIFIRDRSSGSENVSVIPNLSIHTSTDQDWFKFTLPTEGEDGQYVGLNFDNDLGNLQLELFEAFNTTTNTTEAQYLTYLVDRANGNGDSEQINLAGLAKGDYLVRVRGVNGATNPNYNLIFNAPPALETTGDWAEKGTITNDTSSTAYDLKTVEGGTSLNGLTIHTNTDKDWFQFKTASVGKEGHNVRIDFAHNLGDLDLILYDQNGTVIKGRSETTENYEEIDLKTLPAGTYKVQVLGYKGATNPNYTLSISAPNSTNNLIDPDNLEPNNSFTTATNLDQVNKLSGISGLTIHSSDNDYFKFTTTKLGTASNSLSIAFEHAQGDLQLELYKEGSPNPTLSKFSRGTTNNETIPLDGLAAGTYYARVFGNTTTVANGYQLYIDAPTEAVQTKDEWTIFVYMTGSDLAESAFDDINEMEYAASLLPSNVNITVLWDQSSQLPTYTTGTNPAWGDTGWAVIRPDTDDKKIATTFTLLGEKDTGNPNTLVEFLNIAKTAAPANKYGLIMWDHGGGEIGGFNIDNEGIRTQTNASRLYTDELASALSQVKTGGLNLDLLAFDACLMGMSEVAYALSAYTKVFVASQESEGDTGYDYTTAFSSLLGNPSQVTANDLANSLISSYQQQYQGDRRNWDTLAATDTSQISTFVNALKSFTTAAVGITTASTWDAIHDARDAATSFFQNPNYRDLGQFLQAIATSPNTALSSLKTTAQNAYNALQTLVVNQTLDKRNTEGLSVYLPNSGSIDAGYISRNSAFFTATNWKTFLDAFLTRGTNNGTTLALDWAESNEVAARAYNFNTLIGDGYTFNDLSIHKPSDVDWYRFSIQGTGTTTDRAIITYSNANSQRLTANLYKTENGNRVKHGQTSDTGSGTETLGLSGLASGEYWIEVKGNNIIPQYSLKFDTPGTVSNGNDWIVGNDIPSKAYDLGIIAARSLFTGLQIAPSTLDYFEFETPKNQLVEPGRVTVTVVGTQTVTAELLSNNTSVVTKTGTGNLQLDYPGEPGKTYQLKISGTSAVGYFLDFQPLLVTQGGGPTSGNDTINGTANNDNLTGLAGNDTINGLAGNDTLDGGVGNDSLIGGIGNDTYIVDSASDFVTENSNEGTDTVQSSVTYTLGNNLENLILTGTAAINGTGNTLNNTITGNTVNNNLNGGTGNDTLIGGTGNDTLIGGTGNDSLTGGTGLDRFKFNSRTEGLDQITDFSLADDTIEVSAAGFGSGLTANRSLTTNQFVIGTAATTSAQRFIYNSSTGALLFDADGSASGASIQITTLNTGLAMTNLDIFVTA
ncbi:hypothetical protein C7H19_18145 [Aphanothece hegewaldii CCALA 016]|uniref:Uncharacterized protein n=1 Tax=Aphanothece hegewaldii CCALA 016 TaxID=2107694 RepID=A0A2T1LUC8_9CHRO|nr:pre-peptidase C-terminal domain-containing protein [Aphanothece hegewaldii]PSF34929.1 hypothetical protein C7H19_18145 [Aphanothece hegewaldii CCALA 016]